MAGYKTVKNENKFEITEKRSRFIGYLCPAANEAEALAKLEAVRAEHRDARHNVYAYRLRENNISRFSDDGEPHGTGGKPVLDIINGSGLENVILVVTRYFGGVLLGTGGLQRAYSEAAAGAVGTAEIAELAECSLFSAKTEYSMFDKLVYVINKCGEFTGAEYGEKVKIFFSIEREKSEELILKLREAAGSQLEIKALGTGFIERTQKA